MQDRSLGRELVGIARGLGAHEVRIIRRRRHPAIAFVVAGRRYVHCYPGTPSDWRSHANSVGQLARRIRRLIEEEKQRALGTGGQHDDEGT